MCLLKIYYFILVMLAFLFSSPTDTWNHEIALHEVYLCQFFLVFLHFSPAGRYNLINVCRIHYMNNVFEMHVPTEIKIWIVYNYDRFEILKFSIEHSASFDVSNK